MGSSSGNLREACEQFAGRQGIVLESPLGSGWDGSIWATNRQSALKAFRYRPGYERERDVYKRLKQQGIERIRSCHVPSLLQADDELLVVEMTIVQPPYVLDFAGARLDHPHEFPDDVWDQWNEEKREQFGNDWPEVQRIIAAFERYKIYLSDVHPRNICFTAAPS
jgi:hypothetical protein